jgi:hypothetical protein
MLLSVPPPANPSHRLTLICRPEAVEIAYECGTPRLRAEARFSLHEIDAAAAIFCVREFLREIRSGEMIVFVRPLPLIPRLRRRAGVRSVCHFRNVSSSVDFGEEFVYRLQTTRGSLSRRSLEL